jgi:hypothetical protein
MPVVSVRGAKEMVRDLQRMREKAVPFAIRNSLNTAAFETRKIWQSEIRKTFTNRNQYTVRSVRVEQASTTTLEAKVGSVAEYMGTQEQGGTVKGKSGHIKAIPTAKAAGQAGGARTRLVSARYYLGAIQVAHVALRGGRRQQNAIAIAVARKQGKKVVLLTRPGGAKGLFVLGAGTKRKLSARLLWDVSRRSVHVHAQPTLVRSIAAVKPKLEHMLEASITQQLQRLRIGK